MENKVIESEPGTGETLRHPKLQTSQGTNSSSGSLASILLPVPCYLFNLAICTATGLSLFGSTALCQAWEEPGVCFLFGDSLEKSGVETAGMKWRDKRPFRSGQSECKSALGFGACNWILLVSRENILDWHAIKK